MAAADSLRVIRNAPHRIHFVILNGNGDVVVNLNNLSAKISKDSGTATSTTNVPVEVGASGMVYLDLTVTEMTFSYGAHVLADASNSNATDAVLFFSGEPCLDSGVCQSGSGSATAVLRASASATDDLYNGAAIEIVRGTGAGQTRTITDYVGSSKIATVDRNWATVPDSTSVYLIHPVSGTPQATAGLPSVNVTQLGGETGGLTVLKELYQGAIAASVSDDDPSTTDFDGSGALSATADFYNKSFLVFTTGTLKGLMRPINDYSSGRNISFAVGDAWPVAPTDGDEFVILSYKP